MFRGAGDSVRPLTGQFADTHCLSFLIFFKHVFLIFPFFFFLISINFISRFTWISSILLQQILQAIEDAEVFITRVCLWHERLVARAVGGWRCFCGITSFCAGLFAAEVSGSSEKLGGVVMTTWCCSGSISVLSGLRGSSYVSSMVCIVSFWSFVGLGLHHCLRVDLCWCFWWIVHWHFPLVYVHFWWDIGLAVFAQAGLEDVYMVEKGFIWGYVEIGVESSPYRYFISVISLSCVLGDVALMS